MPIQSFGRLQAVNLCQYWQDEARDFTTWLAKPENIELLSDTLGIELELEGIEIPVGPYKADLVARDVSSDTRVVIENQLEKTNHDHLGKVLTYASGLDARVLIWIAREFTEEHRRAFDFINELSAPNLRCYGIEMQLWRIGDSVPAPLFKIISSPNEYTTEIKTDAARGELTEATAFYLDFWSGFRDYCLAHPTALKIRKPRPQHWFSIAVGRSKFQISLTASLQHRRTGCEIYMRGKNAKIAFRLLEAQKPQIEAVTGPLTWMELPQKQDCRIVLYQPDVNLQDRTTWPALFSWYKTHAENFHRAFAPIIKSLPDLDAYEMPKNDSE